MQPLILLVVLASGPAETPALDIPYFARKYDIPCAQCHVVPPKLNEFGRSFRERGYTLPGRSPERTWPFALWVSGRGDVLSTADASGPIPYVNRVEVVSGGELGVPWLSYFLEWRPVSYEARADGTLRDRSGRFEDLFLEAELGSFELMAGQFRSVQQVDVSQRLSLSEPLVLSAGLAWTGEADVRTRELRGFSPAQRSPALRLGHVSRPGGWRWTNAVSVPLPGELSIPLTREARTEASNAIELRPKGLFLESYARRGFTTVGGHGFVDGETGRLLVNGVTTGARGPWHWAALAGLERRGDDDPFLGRWSLEAEYFPAPFAGLGARLEDRVGDGLGRALLPYAAVHFPGSRYTIRLTVEQRIQAGRNATLVELGTVF